MPKRINVEDIVGTIEIAERLGRKPYEIRNWMNRPWMEFPAPLANVSGRPIWNWPEVAKWRAKTTRL